jgi:hypothetical protein
MVTSCFHGNVKSSDCGLKLQLSRTFLCKLLISNSMVSREMWYTCTREFFSRPSDSCYLEVFEKLTRACYIQIAL